MGLTMADKKDLSKTKKMTADNMLSGKQVAAYVEAAKQGRYKRNLAYYQGNNVEIIATGRDNAKNNQDPNNIVPLPFGRRTINDLSGYAYKPGNVRYVPEEESAEGAGPDPDVQKINDIFKNNKEEIESAELFTGSGIQGESAELVYFADKKIQFAKIPREQCIFIYKDTVKGDTLEFSIRFYQIITVDDDGKEILTHKTVVYFPERADFYEWKERTHSDAMAGGGQMTATAQHRDYKYKSSQILPFSKVPLHPYQINSDLLGVFEPSIPIINKLDGFGSDSISNAIDQFNDTILLLSKSVTKEVASKLKDSKVIDALGGKEEGNFAEFLQRNLDIEGVLESTKLFERWYYELTGVPNLNDEKFGTKSGIAIAYALVPFENLVTVMEIYFTKGLLYRLDLINDALMFLKEISKPVKMKLDWTRNLPFDLKGRADVVKILKEAGIFSDETLLKMFPKSIVEDVKKELDRKKKQDDEAMEAFMKNNSENTDQPDADTKDEDDEE